MTLLTYDGHGRLKTRKGPTESGVTTYNYNADDLVQSVTDARGVTNAFVYNNRHPLTSASYGTASGVSAAPNVAFTYDAAGNRTKMTDGMGEVSYTYDTLSRLTAEARTFNDPGNASVNGLVRGLNYTYNLADQVTSVTDPFNSTINYNYDAEGQAHSVTGSGDLPGGVWLYAHAIRYRAWGTLRSLSYGNGLWLSTSYDSRMRVSRFEVGGRPSQLGGPTVMLDQYGYHSDGAARFADNGVDDKFDRAYSFDHAGRLKEAYTGAEARNFAGGAPGGAADGPYRQSYVYDPWGNMTSRTGRYWSENDNYSDSYDASNRNPRWQYGPAGNLTRDDQTSYTWDAAGRVTRRDGSYASGGAYYMSYVDYHYDGDSQVVKERQSNSAVTYNVHSSVLGRVITELDSQGGKKRTRVYAAGGPLAQQSGGAVEWIHSDPVTGSRQRSGAGGGYSAGDELDPMGASVGLTDPFVQPPGGVDGSASQDPDVPGILGLPDLHRGQCTLDGVRTECGYLGFLTDVGATETCPQNNCGPRSVTVNMVGVSGATYAHQEMTLGYQTNVGPIAQSIFAGTLDGGYVANNPTAGLSVMGMAYSFAGNAGATRVSNGTPPQSTPQLPKTPKLKNATPAQQKRFDDAFTEMWRRLHERGGNNPCAELFGGIKKAEKALKDTKFSVGAVDADAFLQTVGKNITIDPNKGFFDTSGSMEMPIGTRPHPNPTLGELPYLPVSVSLGNVAWGAFALLHELGHRTGTLEPDGDDRTGIQSVLNSGKVKAACFGELETPKEPR